MNTATVQLADSQHPWVGLASFTEGDREFFAGRGEEIEELLRLVRRDTLTLLYGVSGLGKTSLLQAGLFPALRAEDYLPVPIRLDYVEGAVPLTAQVFGAITAAANAARVEAPQPRPDETLWEYFHCEGNHFWSPRNDLVTPFLALDQFEELFTLGRETPECAARATAFISELADLVENRPPVALREDPLRAKEFSFKPAPLKVLLAMREDYLADLDRIRSHFRALGQNRLRLLPMGERQARQVIALGAQLLAPGVEDRILNFLAGGDADADAAEITIAPALLSLVLRELNERRLARAPDAKITPDLLDVEQQKIFEDFYLRTVQDFPPGVRTFIEDKLLTTTGYRDNCALDDALSCPDVTLPILNELVNRRLLAYEDRHHTRRVELTHDVLVPVIKASRDTRLAREALARAEQQKRERIRKKGVAFSFSAVILVLAFGFCLYSYQQWRKEQGDWIPELSVDFSKPPKPPRRNDQEQFEFQDAAATKADPWPVSNGAMIMKQRQWCWLKVGIRGDVKVLIELRFAGKPEAFQVCINAKKKLRDWNHHPPGYSCRFGIWAGSLNIITRDEVDRQDDFNSLVVSATPELFAPAQRDAGNAPASTASSRPFFSLAFERRGERVSLQVNDKEVHYDTYLMPLLVKSGAQDAREPYENIGLRTWAKDGDVEIRSIYAYRFKLPESANPTVAGDSLVETGHLDEAIKKYRTIASDYEGVSIPISTLALTKAFLLAVHQKDPLRRKLHGELLDQRQLAWWHPVAKRETNKYLQRVREVETLALWREGNRREALKEFPAIFQANSDTRIAIECLQAEHGLLEPGVSEEFLGWVAKTSKFAGLDISSLGLENLSAIKGLDSLKGLDCHGNLLTSLEPLRGMKQLRALYCQQNQIQSLDSISDLDLFELYCNANQIESLKPLRGMPLKTLYCNDNRISDLSPLEGMPLNALDCSRNRIRSLEPVASLSSLSELYCASNQLTTIEPLRKLKALVYLDCSENEIKSLEPLQELRQNLLQNNLDLYALNCSGNQLVTLEPFVENPPSTFLFNCKTLPDAEIERANAVWAAKGLKVHANYARLMLALRHGDFQKAKSLASEFGGHSYLYLQQPLSAQEAEQFCAKLGGHLVTITSEEENAFLKEVVPAHTSCRIGMVVSDATPEWVTGEPVGFKVTDFRPSDRIVTWKDGAWLPLAAHEDKAMPAIIEWE